MDRSEALKLPIKLLLLCVLSTIAGCAPRAHDDPASQRVLDRVYSEIGDSAIIHGIGNIGEKDSLTDAIKQHINGNGTYGFKAHFISAMIAAGHFNYPSAMRDLLWADRIAVENDDHEGAYRARIAMMQLCGCVYDMNGEREFGLRAYDSLKAAGIKDLKRWNFVVRLFKINELGNRIDNEFMEELLEDYRNVSDEYGDSISELDVWVCELLMDHANMEENGKMIPFTRFEQFKNEIYEREMAPEFLLPDTLVIMLSQFHDFITDLHNEGKSELAGKFMNELKKDFKADDFMNTWIVDVRPAGSKHVYAYESPSWEKLMSTFQGDVNMEVKNFDNDEILMRNQIVSQQRRIVMLTVGLLVLVVGFSVFYIRMLRERSRRRHEELLDSVKALDANFKRVQKDLYKKISGLCDVYYKNTVQGNDRIARECLKSIEGFVQSPDVFGELEACLNGETDGLVIRFREQMGGLREDEYRLFICNALGFSIPALSMLLNEKREVIYNRRLRLRNKIEELNPPDVEEFKAKLV